MPDPLAASKLLSRQNRLILGILLTLVPLLGGCASPNTKLDPEYELREADSYVKLVPVEETAAKNHHPYRISGSLLRFKLSKLSATGNLTLGEKKISLFTSAELARLAGPIAAALARAQPDQDVVFQSAGARGMLAEFSPPDFTTGRVFVHDGQLNLILGVAHQQHDDSMHEHYSFAFKPGSREQRIESGWNLVEVAGMTFDERGDWVKFQVEQSEATGTGTAPPVQREPLPLPVESPVESDQPDEAKPLDSDIQAKSRKIENRLRVLDDLRARGLVTPEEYSRQRRSILDDI